MSQIVHGTYPCETIICCLSKFLTEYPVLYLASLEKASFICSYFTVTVKENKWNQEVWAEPKRNVE